MPTCRGDLQRAVKQVDDAVALGRKRRMADRARAWLKEKQKRLLKKRVLTPAQIEAKQDRKPARIVTSSSSLHESVEEHLSQATQ